MGQIHVVGLVTTDLVLQESLSHNPYVRFSMKEYLGNGRFQVYQVWAYGWAAEHLVKWKVKAGTILDVNGPVFLEDYTEKDGVTLRQRLKIIYKDGGPVLLTSGKYARKSQKEPTTPAASPPADGVPPTGAPLDGDRMPLPE